MKIILGLPDSRIPVWQFGTPLMINQLSWSRIPWKNETWVDSGGYQIMTKGKKITLEEVLKKYMTLNASYFMSLDYPTFCSDVDETNFKNFEYLYQHVKTLPIIHAYTPDSIDKSLDFYKQYTNSIAYGGIVPPSLKGGRKIVTLIYHYLRRKISYIHVLGAGSPYMRKIFFNADSVDTATYRIKGANGLVLIPGKGERYVGNRKVVWKARRATEEELNYLFDFLEKTHYPFEIDISKWENRALINAWVLLHSEYEEYNYNIEYSKQVEKMGNDSLRQEIEEMCKVRNNGMSAS
ncbi:hypothetical protein DFR86_02195 [Acidianus sulfidivorans JP7]|uniref:Uncharacterized protein n=1 Tax=Acidianus sulfidivorans JP7 TaxID=619593 RepID=A0A2U9IKB3_9CREN|nr:hypothetical protein [Acidianus sulfidivorans]AWR96477.1 hypothetical protein DFR86_02195 [Acidianus sulfidivorans JP7]